MKQLQDFKNIHAGESTIVMGCGQSVYDVPYGFDTHVFKSIGCNDIGTWCSPKYLFIMDQLNGWVPQTHREYAKKRIMKSTQSDYVFVRQPIDWIDIEQVQIEREQIPNGHNLGDILERNHLWALDTTPFTMLSFAVYAGFKRIGLIGVDYCGKRAFHDLDCTYNMDPLSLKTLNLRLEAIREYCDSIGVEIINLSNQSKITAFRSGWWSDLV
jgi:hypothetical protein